MYDTARTAWLALLGLAAAVPGQSYELTPITPAGGMAFEGRDLGADGTVVGRIYNPINRLEPSAAAIWRDGQVVLLPDPAGGTTDVEATHIDSAGRIWGRMRMVGVPATAFQPVLWQNGTVSLPPTLFDGVGAQVYPSPSGTFVASLTLPFDNPTTGWRNEFGWEAETDFTLSSGDLPQTAVLDMRTMGQGIVGGFRGSTYNVLSDINDRGIAVGFMENSGSGHMPIRWDARQGAILLSNLGRSFAVAVAINERGTIVGETRVTDPDSPLRATRRTCVWRGDKAFELDPPPGFGGSWPRSINDHDVVVGVASPIGQAAVWGGAWLWDRGQVIDLNTRLPAGSGWSLTEARSINNRGQILVTEAATLPFRGARFAVLTPVRTNSGEEK